MIYTDTRDKTVKANFRTAVLNGMNAETGGLYIPVSFPKLASDFINKTPEPNFRDISFAMAKPYVEGEIPDDDLESLIQDAYPFSPQIAPVDPVSYVLELFHGPTCAFHNVPGLDVTILYPDGKISPLQEKQLSTFDGNVRALKVKGTFDDCQKLVKTAFTDNELRSKFRLSSANSINISRLLPQSFYYMYSALVVRSRSWNDNKIENPAIIAVVPSGNFGNLTSGLIAYEMGAPITGFVAATNSNHTVPDWIATGEYKARPSVATYANAMDVGAPSNYERIAAMYTLDQVRSLFASYWLDNNGILDSIKNCYDRTGYMIDPHGAVGWKAWNDIRSGAMKNLKGGLAGDYEKPGLTPNLPSWADKVINKQAVGIVLETAHPAKFGAIVKEATGREPSMPDRLAQVMKLPDHAIPMDNDYSQFKEWLTENL